MIELEGIDKAVDSLDRDLEKKGLELTPDEADEIRDLLQGFMEDRMGI